MQPGERLRQALVIAGQAPETSHPVEAPFDDPAAWQQHEAFLSRRQLDHFQLDVVGCLGFRGCLAGNYAGRT